MTDLFVAHKSLFDVIGKFNPEVAISMDVGWFAQDNDSYVPEAILSDALLYRQVHDAIRSLQLVRSNVTGTAQSSTSLT